MNLFNPIRNEFIQSDKNELIRSDRYEFIGSNKNVLKRSLIGDMIHHTENRM